MIILVVDDASPILNLTVNNIKKVRPNDEVIGFTNPKIAIESIEEKHLDVYAAFLDIEMYIMNGVQLAAKIKKICPKCHIVFITAYSEYAVRAFELKVSGYLLKPASIEDIKKEFLAMNEPQVSIATSKRIRAHTFGNFELFIDNEPVHFSRSKAKELLAYLIDRRGASMTMRELTAVLFDEDGDDKKYQQQLRVAILELKKTLSELNADDILIKEHNSISVNINNFSCDYYDFLKSDAAAVNSFTGEYMSNYAWAEFTVAELCDKK